MKLSTRFGVGAALAVLPLVGVLVFSVERMQDLARSNERLTTRQLVGAQMSTGVISRLERLEEYLRKFSVSEDPGYAVKFHETALAVGEELDTVAALDLSPGEREAFETLSEQWSEFADAAGRGDALADPTLDGRLDDLLEAATEVQRQTRESARSEVAAATELRSATRTTALTVAGIAVALSLSLILLTVRSIRTRLEHFIVGTRAVSQGAFSFQLDASASDELGEVARAFNRMTEALRQLERMKADFTSSISHELRTPLVAMQETNGLLLDEVPGPLTAGQRRMLTLNDQAVSRLSNMISDLLDLSRLKAGIRYRLSAQDLCDLTLDAVAEFEALAAERKVELQVSVGTDPTPSLCDPDRYVQVVQNLAENGLKYTPSGGTVRVELQPTVRDRFPEPARASLAADRPYALLQVDDTGPGIPEVDRERVFEKFFRRQGLPSDGGVGLGLAICREIVRAHGGEIWVEDGRMGGASLCVAWPLEARAEATGRRSVVG